MPHSLAFNHCFDPIFHWLYFLYILWILDLYSAFFYILYHLIVVSFDFTLFWYFFSFLLITTTFSLTNLFYLLLPHTFSLVFIDFTLFNFFLLFHFIDAFFFIVIRFFSFTSFWTLFLWFYSLTVFLWFSCYSVDSTILGEFLAVFMLCGCYFLLITSSGGCPHYTFRHLIPQGTQNQGGQAHFPKMQLLTKSSTDIVVLKILAFAL